MKTTMLTLASATLFWTAAASAAPPASSDPYASCTDAYNYGQNMAHFYVSAVYNKAACNRDLATRFEAYVFDVIPAYWAQEAEPTTPEKAACLLQGSFAAWMDTTERQYLIDCPGVPGFDTIQRKLIGHVSASLFSAFYFVTPGYYTPDVVSASFAFDFSTWPLAGTPLDCSVQIDVRGAGVPQELLNALKAAVC